MSACWRGPLDVWAVRRTRRRSARHRCRMALARPHGACGADNKKGADRPPLFVFSVRRDQLEAKARYFSLPTKPNLLTPDALMMFSTLTERS